MSLLGEVILRASRHGSQPTYSWITKGCISVTFRNQTTVHTYMYALKEKYRALEVGYQTNIYPISIQSFTR